MNWTWNRCRRRPEISLLASGALKEEEKIELESHLAGCQECRSYYGEIRAVIEPLAGWEKQLSPIEATPATRMRWARAVQEEARTSSSVPNPQGLRLRLRISMVWVELIRPSRYAWAGMAALWLVMLAVNGQLSEHRMIEAGASPSSTQDMIQAWEEQYLGLAELTQPTLAVPATPAILPRPRSERERDWKIV